MSAHADTYRALLPHVSHISLSTLACVSKSLATLVHEEAIRRYFPNKKTYLHESLRGFDTKDLTMKAAYYFLAKPREVSRPKLAHACASRDPDMVSLALKKGATDYFDGCVVAAMNGDADTCILLSTLWRKEPYRVLDDPSRVPAEHYFDEYVGELLDIANTDPSPMHILDHDLTQIASCAAYMGGNQKLIDYFTTPSNPSYIIFGVCRGNRIDLVDWVFDKFPDHRPLLIPAAGNNMPIIRYLVEKKHIQVTDEIIADTIWCEYTSAAYLLAAPSAPSHLPKTFKAACSLGQLEIVKKSMPNDRVIIHKGFIRARYWGRADVMEFISHHYTVDWNETLLEICRERVNENPEGAVQLCIDKGATNLEAAFALASDSSDKAVAHYLVDAMFP
jgi:hypothetical protein